MNVTVEKADEQKLTHLKVTEWPIWEKEISSFDYFYDTGELFYVLEGKVSVEIEGDGTVEFGKGDLVFFKKGTRCKWTVIEPIRKHYKML